MPPQSRQGLSFRYREASRTRLLPREIRINSKSAAHLIEQMENHSNPRKINFQFFAQRANHPHAPQCVPIVKRFDASASVLDAHWRDQILALPRGQLTLADSADSAEDAAAHQHYFAACRTS